MSRSLDIADLIKARLEAVSALAGIDVVVDRQRNITALIASAVGKAKGNCITILYEGFSVPDPNSAGPRLLVRYTIRDYCRPILEKATKGDRDAIYADEVIEEIAKSLHHWVPEHAHSFGEMTVTGGDLVPDPRWLIYELEAEVAVQL
jgi:hypothetical protein